MPDTRTCSKADIDAYHRDYPPKRGELPQSIRTVLVRLKREARQKRRSTQPAEQHEAKGLDYAIEAIETAADNIKQ